MGGGEICRLYCEVSSDDFDSGRNEELSADRFRG